MRVALVLEGGAMRGLYTAGVLDVFMENNINVDAIIGVSAGALFGINYLTRQIGRVLRYNKKYLNDKRYMGFYSWFTTGDIMNKEFCFNELVYKLDKFEFDTFRSSKIDFYATVTNLHTGKAEYIKIDDLERGDNLEYLRASGSMPLVSNIVKIGKNEYLDGGISDSIPVREAYSMGYDKVIVVLTRPLGYRKKKSNMLLYKFFYRRYPKLLLSLEERYSKYNDILSYIDSMQERNNMFVVRPSKDLGVKRLEKDVAKIEALYELGKTDAMSSLKDLEVYCRGN